MNAHADELDRLIDALNVDRELIEDRPIDPDLLELLDLARDLKEIQHVRWPDDTFPMRAAFNLSARLGPNSGKAVRLSEVVDAGSQEGSMLPAMPVDSEEPRRIARFRRKSSGHRWLQIAAAVLVLFAFTGVVSLLMRGAGRGSPTTTSQLGQGLSIGPIAAPSDVFPTVRSVDDAGNSRYMHVVKSDAEYTVTLEWAGSTQAHVLVAMTIKTQRGEHGDISPYQISMQTNDGTKLAEIGVTCKQSVCLAQFDRTSIEGRTGDIPLHLEISGLLTGTNAASVATVGAGTMRAVTAPDVSTSFAFDLSIPTWSIGEATAPNIPTPVITLKSRDQASGLGTMSSLPLSALQQAAGFGLYAPTELPDGLTLEQPQLPVSKQDFTSVVLKYVDSNGKEALVITESSPYQQTAQTMPANVWNNARSVDIGSIGYGQVSARIYQSDGDVQLWWQVGPTSIRLESGGTSGTTVLTESQLLDIALWMMPVSTTTESTPVVPSDATVQTSDQAVAKVRAVISSLGGSLQSEASKVTLVPLSEEVAAGIPQPMTIDPTASVWVVQFDTGLTPQECPDNWVSVCNGSPIVFVVDATSGEMLGFHG